MDARQDLRSQPLSLDQVLAVWLPRRVNALEGTLSVLNLCEKFDDSTPISITIAGKPAMNLNLSTFADPLIDIGFLHARALLEFLGLGARKGKLVQITKRQASDIAIEHYSINGKSLSMVSPTDVFGAINMPQPVIEWSLVNIIETANKLIAHVTTGEVLAMAMYQQVRIGFESIPVLLQDHLYAKLETTQEQPKPICERYACNHHR
jgi:hypothetical protein